MAKYREIADDLRRKIQAGVYPVGSQLPTIAELQAEYGVPGLNTIRAAQQLLVDEGMIETRQGIGAFVISASSARDFDVTAAVASARDSLTAALAAMASQAKRRIAIDLEAEEYASFVLTEALGEFAARERHQAEDDPQGDRHRIEWAECAERLRDQIEAAG
jgi:DNA-binding GntR family transcriptional regulator